MVLTRETNLQRQSLYQVRENMKRDCKDLLFVRLAVRTQCPRRDLSHNPSQRLPQAERGHPKGSKLI